MPYQFPHHIFRAYDIRGSVKLLNDRVVGAIAHGLAKQYLEAGQTCVAIGYDARLSSPRYASILSQILESYTIETKVIGCCSSPILYFAAQAFDGNGIMVTASHNPKDDNGIKWIVQGEPPCPEAIQAVAKVASQHDLPLSLNTTNVVEMASVQAYQNAIQHDIQISQPYKVVLDGMHGATGYAAVSILEQLGCELVCLRCEPNGHFPDHAPDPSKESHLKDLRERVVKYQADIGIALDGDGDRLVLIDHQGEIISADQLLCLFAEICLNKNQNQDLSQAEFVFDVKCSTQIRDAVVAYGATPVMIRTGSSFLRKYLAQSKGRAIFGGEYAGHYVFNDGRGGGYDDGLYAALRVLEYLDQTQQSLAEALQPYPKRVGTEDLYISTHGIASKQVLEYFESQAQNVDAQISKIDGIRLDFDDGFGIIRASNTGEYFTVRFDAKNQTRLDEIRQLFVRLLHGQYPTIAQDILDAQ